MDAGQTIPKIGLAPEEQCSRLMGAVGWLWPAWLAPIQPISPSFRLQQYRSSPPILSGHRRSSRKAWQAGRSGRGVVYCSRSGATAAISSSSSAFVGRRAIFACGLCCAIGLSIACTDKTDRRGVPGVASFVTGLRDALNRNRHPLATAARQLLMISISSKGLVESSEPVAAPVADLRGASRSILPRCCATKWSAKILLGNETLLVAAAVGRQ